MDDPFLQAQSAIDVQAAEDWINRLEKIFKVLDCLTKWRAQMAIYKVEKDADDWWKNTELILNVWNMKVTWEVFLEQFYEKYFPRSIRDKKETEFLTVNQKDSEPFDEYLVKFICLSYYSSYMCYWDDEKWMTEKMIRGLRQSLREMIAPKQFEYFNNAVKACRITENNLNHHLIGYSRVLDVPPLIPTQFHLIPSVFYIIHHPPSSALAGVVISELGGAVSEIIRG
ncbi:uncharacterized protein LOC114756624 [Neltuma alba]|uniref:uncharacterized protein LOC114756624 n=1 Tax=Neltuma alba TaxID=207710 RepID=UPI0010A4429D|nr:uncharacterized protein LOC114756624 [Prosopis alba]